MKIMDMPIMKKRRTVASQAAARGPLPALPEALLDELVKGPMTPAEVQDLMLAFNKALIERAMGAEMTARPTSATAPAARRSSPSAARSGSICRATAKAASSRS
jgi:hypothetical protein